MNEFVVKQLLKKLIEDGPIEFGVFDVVTDLSVDECVSSLESCKFMLNVNNVLLECNLKIKQGENND